MVVSASRICPVLFVDSCSVTGAGAKTKDRLFYFGRATDVPDYYAERLLVYDRAGKQCPNCKTPIKRIVQAARSTFYCPRCQR